MADEVIQPVTQTATTPVAPATHVHTTVAAPTEKEMFSAEYVKELRAENASYRTRASEAKAEKEAAEAKALAAQQSADAKVGEAQKVADQRIIRAELKTAALKAGMVDLDGLKLADLTAIKLDEKGEVVGAEELMKSLKEAKPYLFGAPATTTTTTTIAPKKEPAKPFDARKATPEEVSAQARKLGLNIKTH